MSTLENCLHHRTLPEIIWSCLATIFACTWVAVHPSVPLPAHNSESLWYQLKRRAALMTSAILAPEFMVFWAIGERLVAARIVEEYNRLYDIEQSESAASASGRKWTLTHGFFLLMNGFMLHNEKGDPIGTLTCAILFQPSDANKLEFPLIISRREIEDKSKGDFLTKLVVVSQTTWFVIQCIGRTGAGLPLTELEVTTLAFALLNVITYMLWWHKPQNVNLPIPVVLKPKPSIPSPQLVEGINIRNPQHQFCLISHLRELHSSARGWAGFLGLFFQCLTYSLISNDVDHHLPCRLTQSDSVRRSSAMIVRVSLSVTAMVFGGFHLLSWSGLFPSAAERLMWRLFAILYTFIPVTWMSLALINSFGWMSLQPLQTQDNTVLRSRWTQLVLILVPGYVLARLALIAIAFSSLRALPTDAFSTFDWSRFMPHFQ